MNVSPVATGLRTCSAAGPFRSLHRSTDTIQAGAFAINYLLLDEQPRQRCLDRCDRRAWPQSRWLQRSRDRVHQSFRSLEWRRTGCSAGWPARMSRPLAVKGAGACPSMFLNTRLAELSHVCPDCSARLLLALRATVVGHGHCAAFLETIAL